MANLAYKLQRGLGTVGEALMRRDERERLEADRARRNRMQDLETDLRLAELQGGRGPRPTETVTLGEEMARPASFNVPEGPLTSNPRPSMGVRADPSEVAGPVDLKGRGFEMRRVDPRYQSVGDGMGYIMRPEVRRESARVLDEAADRRSLDRRGRTMGEALAGVRPDMDADEAMSAGRGLAAGVPVSLMAGPEEATDDYTIRNVDGRPYRIGPGGESAEPIPGIPPRTSPDGRRITVSAGGITRSFPDTDEGRADAIAWREEVSQDEDEWQDPPGMADMGEDRLARVYPRAVARWKESGFTEWNPEMDTGGGADADTGDQGMPWYKRLGNKVLPGDPFGKNEVAASEAPSPTPGRRDSDLIGPSSDGMDPVADSQPAPSPGTEGPETSTLEADIREALEVDGETPQQIISGLQEAGAPEQVINDARQILSRITGG